MEKKFLVDATLLEYIANYLSKRPYEEVVNIMTALAKLKPYEEPKKEDDLLS